MSKRRHIWKRCFWGFVAITIAFLVFRISTEVGQRRDIWPSAMNLFIRPIDQYCTKHSIKWNNFVESRYHYWSPLSITVRLWTSENRIAEVNAIFECRWFGMYLKKVRISRGHIRGTPWIDVTEDFLSDKLEYPTVYFDRNPLPSPETEYLSADANFEEKIAFMKKNIKYSPQRILNELSGNPSRKIQIFQSVVLFLCSVIFLSWLLWGTLQVWNWIRTYRFGCANRVRRKLIIELLGLPLLIGILIFSMVLADPSNISMPKGLSAIYSTNAYLVLMGVILYIVRIVILRKRIRQLVHSGKLRKLVLSANDSVTMG